MAAKTTYWIGSSNGDWSNGSNWTNGQPSTVGDKDTVIISKDAVASLVNNLDRSGDDGTNGLDLARFEIEEGCNVAVGSSTEPLIFGADLFVVRGGASVYFDPGSGSTGSFNVGRLIVDSPEVAFNLLDGATNAIAIGGVEYLSGWISHAAKLLVSRLFIGRSQRHAATPYVTLLSSNTAPTFVHMQAGEVIQQGVASGFDIVSGGLYRMQTTSSLSDLYQTGGVVRLELRDSSLTNVFLIGGIFDAGKATSGAIANLWQFPHATLIDNPSFSITSHTILGE